MSSLESLRRESSASLWIDRMPGSAIHTDGIDSTATTTTAAAAATAMNISSPSSSSSLSFSTASSLSSAGAKMTIKSGGDPARHNSNNIGSNTTTRSLSPGGGVVLNIDSGDAAVSALASSFEIKQMDQGIYRVREKFYHAANIFVVLGRDMDLIVDSGVGVWDLFGFLQLHLPGFGMRKPVLAVATNVHFDHSGGLHDLRARGCQVAIHELEAAALSTGDNYATCSCFSEQDFRKVSMAERLTLKEYAVRPTEVTRTLKDGDNIDLGDRRFTVLHLPGHSSGSIALLDKRCGILFSGDVVYDGTILDWLPSSNVFHRVASYKRLQEVSSACIIQVVYPGHFHEFNGKRLICIVSDYLCRAGVGYRTMESCMSVLASAVLLMKNSPITYYACCCCCKCVR